MPAPHPSHRGVGMGETVPPPPSIPVPVTESAAPRQAALPLTGAPPAWATSAAAAAKTSSYPRRPGYDVHRQRRRGKAQALSRSPAHPGHRLEPANDPTPRFPALGPSYRVVANLDRHRTRMMPTTGAPNSPPMGYRVTREPAACPNPPGTTAPGSALRRVLVACPLTSVIFPIRNRLSVKTSTLQFYAEHPRCPGLLGRQA